MPLKTFLHSYIITFYHGPKVDLFQDKTQFRFDIYAFRYVYTIKIFPSMYMYFSSFSIFHFIYTHINREDHLVVFSRIVSQLYKKLEIYDKNIKLTKKFDRNLKSYLYILFNLYYKMKNVCSCLFSRAGHFF